MPNIGVCHLAQALGVATGGRGPRCPTHAGDCAPNLETCVPLCALPLQHEDPVTSCIKRSKCASKKFKPVGWAGDAAPLAVLPPPAFLFANQLSLKSATINTDSWC